MAFTSDAAPESAVAIAGALITLWGLAVLVVAGPRFLSLRGKVVGLDGGGTGFVERGRIGTGGAWKS